MSGQVERLQNSDTVPQRRLMCSKKPIAVKNNLGSNSFSKLSYRQLWQVWKEWFFSQDQTAIYIIRVRENVFKISLKFSIFGNCLKNRILLCKASHSFGSRPSGTCLANLKCSKAPTAILRLSSSWLNSQKSWLYSKKSLAIQPVATFIAKDF